MSAPLKHVGRGGEANQRKGTVGGTGDECSCKAFLPSSTFHIQDLEEVEEVAVEVNHKLELELGKVPTLTLTSVAIRCQAGEEHVMGMLCNLDAQPGLQMETYEKQITAYTVKIVNLTMEVDKMEGDPEAVNETHTESMKIQIKQVEALVVELQSLVQASAAVFKSLRETVGLKFLWVFQKSNFVDG